MAFKSVTCVALSCNTCGEPLDPSGDGFERHYGDLAAAIDVARRCDWIVHPDGFAICDTEDAEHSAAIRELMPPEPVPACDGQTEIPFAEPHGVNVVTAPAELGVYTAPRFREAVTESIQAGYYHLIVDLSGTDVIDPTGIGVLVGSLKRATSHGGWVRLAGPSEKVARHLRIVGLHKVFVIADTVEAAISHETKGVH